MKSQKTITTTIAATIAIVSQVNIATANVPPVNPINPIVYERGSGREPAKVNPPAADERGSGRDPIKQGGL
jgi:hypothetical protein